MALVIQKRDGSQVSFNPTKILNRIKKASKGLTVSPDDIFIKVITAVPTDDVIKTTELDKLIAEIAESYTTSHHDYSRLAANVSISSYQKETHESFYEAMKELYEDGVVNEELINIIEKYGPEKIEAAINLERDYSFDYFAWRSLVEMYLLKNSSGVAKERPQHMYMRVALWVTNTLEEAVAYYESLSTQLISPATPILINSGTKIPQLASCVLHYNNEDSRAGLLDTLRDISVYSSDAAGIGLCMSNIRSKQSRINSSGGFAGGLLKYLKIVNESLRFFNQQGRRPGAAGIYIEPWHKDILDLLDIKKNTGKDELRARDLFTALWIPDNFMRAVETDGDWYLFCPNDIKKAGLKPLQEVFGEEYEEQYDKAVELGLGVKIKAQEIWKKIYESQIETGVPYMLSKDNVNKKSNHKNIGTIRQSNLCLSENSMVEIIVDEEEHKVNIKTAVDLFLANKKVLVKSYDIISGQIEYREVVNAALMNPSAEVLEIEDVDSGFKIVCTPNHQIYTVNRGYVEAKDLLEDDILKIL